MEVEVIRPRSPESTSGAKIENGIHFEGVHFIRQNERFIDSDLFRNQFGKLKR
jgi:hypothetical protein